MVIPVEIQHEADSESVRATARNEQPDRSPEFVVLYRRAFAEYGVQALWNLRLVDDPTPADALALTTALRTHGGMDGRRLAEQIEDLCRASQ